MFREANFREFCVVCEKQAESVCPRCKRAFCDGHTPKGSSRCSLCEAEFYTEPGRLVDTGGQARLLGQFTVGLSVPVVATLVTIGAVTMAGVVAAGAAAVLGGLAIRSFRRKRDRTKFLAKGSGESRKLLGSGEPEQNVREQE